MVLLPRLEITYPAQRFALVQQEEISNAIALTEHMFRLTCAMKTFTIYDVNVFKVIDSNVLVC